MAKKNKYSGLLKFEDIRKIKINEETNCGNCLHARVCNFDMSKRCANYEFGTSEYASTSCNSCVLRFTRYPTIKEEYIPCFLCNNFLDKKKIKKI